MPSPRRSHIRPSKATFRRRRLAALGIAIVVVGGVAGGLVATSGGAPTHNRGRRHHPVVVAKLCPLTGLAPASGTVPDRPALAVKIGNEPEGARPQSGLNEADIVYDTPAEGFVMRYMAVYQCNDARAIGPVRSVRWVDWHILQAFKDPIIAFAGGISYDLDTVGSLSWLHGANLLTGAQQAGERITSRVPPDNLYTSTKALYDLFKASGPPPPVFRYSDTLPKRSGPAAALSIDFSQGTDVVWKWEPAEHAWLHTYQGKVDLDALTNKPVTTTNIVVQVVHFTYGPHPESPGSTGDVESRLVGTGTGWVLRDGRETHVAWHRPAPGDPTTFTDLSGHPVKLAPGRTWVEIVLDVTAHQHGAVTITP